MKKLNLSHNKRRDMAALAALSLITGLLAVTHQGVPSAQVDLNDGGVWVTNESLNLAAHLNYPSHALDGGVRVGSKDFDITQHANTVLLHNRGGSSIQPIDTANLVLGNGGTVGAELVSQGGNTALFADQVLGRIWTIPATQVSSFSPSLPATLEDAKGLKGAVAPDGTAYAINSGGKITRITLGDGNPRLKGAGEIKEIKDIATAELTVVGDKVAVLDRAGNTIRTVKGTTPLADAGKVVLQQPSPKANTVVAASPTGLIQAPIDGGAPSVREVSPAEGLPVAPVQLGGCAYAAWAGSGQYLRDCPDDADDVTQTVDPIKPVSKLRFRVNRDVIVLNDVATGLVLMVNENMKLVDNWLSVQSNVEDRERSDEQSNESSPEQNADAQPQDQKPPVANPDEFGVRAGRSTVLPVLLNDSDPNGDPMTASVIQQPTGTTVSQVRGGEALQIAPPEGATGEFSFTYQAADGFGGTAEAPVKVKVHEPSVNEAPASLRQSTMTVAQGAEVSYSVLPDWIDPDGDAVFIQSVNQPQDLSVRFRPDGLVTVRDLGTGTPGTKDIPIMVTDGTKAAQGTLRVIVKQSGDLPPVANPDHLVARQGQQVTVEPLKNDTDPNGTTPRLAALGEAKPGETITPSLEAGTFTFASDQVGAHYVNYTITDGPNTATGKVRVDVEAAQNDLPPIADNDLALLTPNNAAMVDVLKNDSDPDGGVLVIQSVKVPAQGSGLTVEVVDHAKLRISAPAGLRKQTDFTYTISNGSASATAQVTVLPMPPEASTTPPVAVEDAGVVRAGDITTIPVLANDTSPVNLALTLDPKVTVQGDDLGVAFVSGNQLRFRAAGNKSGTARVTYTVRDTAQNYASAEAVIQVTPADGNNAPPIPKQLTGRVVAGSAVDIPIIINDVDPDGDSVTTGGVGSAPGKGTAEISATTLKYTAPVGSSGTDTFTYTVKDRFGLSATGSVQVGIAPPLSTNQPPVAVADEVSVRPGRSLSIPVTQNDLDPDGDQVRLVPGSVASMGDTPVEAQEEGDALLLTTPKNTGALRYTYRISDGRGGTAEGVVTVNVTGDAPLRFPVPRDDVLSATDIAGKDAVEVPVLDNDTDPDGDGNQLKLQINEGGATVTNQHIRVPVTNERQVLVYSVTDVDNQEAKAAIIVPGAASQPPTLRLDRIPAKVKAGEKLTLALDDYVLVRTGRTPKLTFEDRVKPGPGWDGSPAIVNPTTLTYQSKPEFYGKTSLTFEVTDGTNADDKQGQTATLTLPIEVEPNPQVVKNPPVFRGTAILVAAGEPAAQVNLAELATDPDPGDQERLEFKLGPAPADFKVETAGSTLKVGADAAAKPGQTGTIDVTVTDGSTAPVTGQIQVQVVASSRPLLSVRDITINDAKAGQPSRVNLNDYITNPFADQNKPVTLVGTPTVTSGQGTVTADGLNVTVTPAAGFNGQMVVGYTLADATTDVSRQVQGMIRLTVQDRPEPPTAVRAETHQSRTATVAWTAGANNGAQITKFTVKWDGGSKDCGQTTNCVVGGLTNDREYVFTVVATNVVGDSDPSVASNRVRPDTKPNTPSAPTAKYGDRQVSVSWPATSSEGSAVTKYTVEVSPSGGGATQQETSGTSLTWTGLSNGTAYRFRVRAHSKAPDPSEWSPWSNSETPAGLPRDPSAPHVSKQTASTLDPSASVTWSAANGNGDNNLTYELRRTGGDVVYSGTGTSKQLTLAVASTDQTFQVRAKNKVGWSDWSSASNAIRAFKAPGAVTNLKVEPTGSNNSVKISFGAADGNGANASEISYQWKAGGASGTVSSGGGTVNNGSAFPNGQAVQVSVVAVTKVNGESVSGPTQSASVTAYGPPSSPSVSCSGSYQSVECKWSGGSSNGRRTEFKVTGDYSGSGTPGSHKFDGIGYGNSKRICVQAVQDGGATGEQKCDSASSWSTPQSSWSRRGGPCGGLSSCLAVTADRYRPNSTIHCSIDGVGRNGWSGNVQVDGDGHYDGIPTSSIGTNVNITGPNSEVCTQQ